MAAEPGRLADCVGVRLGNGNSMRLPRSSAGDGGVLHFLRLLQFKKRRFGLATDRKVAVVLGVLLRRQSFSPKGFLPLPCP